MYVRNVFVEPEPSVIPGFHPSSLFSLQFLLMCPDRPSAHTLTHTRAYDFRKHCEMGLLFADEKEEERGRRGGEEVPRGETLAPIQVSSQALSEFSGSFATAVATPGR